MEKNKTQRIIGTQIYMTKSFVCLKYGNNLIELLAPQRGEEILI